MKKTLFLSAILATALCSSAFAETVTISGTQNNLNLNDAAYAGKDLILNLTGGYFYGDGVNSVFTQNIQVGDGSENQGGIIGTNGWGNLVTFSGKITGSGEIKKTGKGNNLKHAFTGDVTGYTGNITLGAEVTFWLCFGAVNDGVAATSQNSTAEAGVSGTGDITFTSGNNNLVYKYASSAGTVYITNAIKTNGGTSKVQLLGGASYVLTKASTIDNLTFANNSSLKYTGTTQTTIGGQVAAGSVLEGVITNNVSNVKYTGTYGVNSGTLKNVSVADFDAGADNGSITLDGVYGWLKSGGTQRNITLTGNGLHLTAGYSNASFIFQKLDGAGNLVKQSTCTNETFTFSDTTAWTGKFVNQSGTSNLVFNGNTNADIDVKDNTNVTLKGTDYSGMDITAYNNKTATVTVSNAADTTLHQIIQDPWQQTAGHAALVLDNGHKTTISEWATVDSITLKNSSSVQLNHHSIGTVTMESGSGTLTTADSYKGNGIANLAISDSATLTLAKAMTFTTLTGANGTLTVSKNLTVNGASTIGTLSVSADSTINLAGTYNVGTLKVTGGTTKLFSDAGVGTANRTLSKADVQSGASLVFGAADASVSAITLAGGSTMTVGDGDNHNYSLTTSTLTVKGDSSINANLVVSANGTMDFSAVIGTGATLTMGCSVNIGNDVTVVIDESIIEGIVNRGETVAIIDGVGQITSLGGNWNFVSLNSDGTYKDLSYANLRLDTDGTSRIVVAPEPATATLSLLTLAALAARRKRH